jgi:bla regulator protein BlaR1
MIENNLSTMWRAVMPALGNHVWQSTLFAILAGLLTLILRNNRARTRYLLWLVASIKFLIPFSLLAGIGSHLAWFRGSGGMNAGLYSAIDEISQPFSQSLLSVISGAAPAPRSSTLIELLPTFLAVVWLCGFGAVVLVWYVRWRRISAAVRHAVPLTEGREIEALRRLGRSATKEKEIDILLSHTSLEPGIFGIARPVLVWPKGISERLEDAHLQAILAHELWHVRRRDNLAGAIHMVVEAIFWFHPLVWWMGTRLVEERERACDEEVLESGSDCQVYAESILKICEFCVGSPLTCVSGVTGADLKKRMVYIMTKSVSCKLDFSRKLLLSAAGLIAIAVPIGFGLLDATQGRAEQQAQSTYALSPVFETASIRPNKSSNPMRAITAKSDEVKVTNFTLRMLVRKAYGVQDFQVLGGPSWLDSENFDIEAKMDRTVVDELQKLSSDQRSLETLRMLQSLLADRFHLALHRETKDLPIYALVIAKEGPKIQEGKPGDTYPNGITGLGGRPIGGGGISEPERGKLVGQGCPLSYLTEALSQEKPVGRTVLNKTGLAGNYDFTLQWTPSEDQIAMLTAIQEQLGLKLESQTTPMEILVIDHVEKPSEN